MIDHGVRAVYARLYRRRKLEIISSIGLGLAISMLLGSQLLNFALSLLLLIPGFFSLWAIGSALSYFLVYQVIWPRLRRRSPWVRGIWIGLCLLGGFLLIAVIPLTVYPKANRIHIIATGEKNPASQGSEVLLASIISGHKMPLFGLTHYCRGDWSLREGFLNSIHNQPSELVCVVRTDQGIKIKFGMHPWSGVMRMQYDSASTVNGAVAGRPDQVIEQDLYSPGGGETKEFLLPVSLSPLENIFQWIFFLADGIAIGLLLLAFTVFVGTMTDTTVAKNTVGFTTTSESKALPWYSYALPMLVAWGIYLLAFWPGFFSPDSLNQFEQIVSGQFNDWHPAFHTMSLWLVTRLGLSLALVNFFQIVLLSCLLGWGFSLVERGGTPRWVIFLGLAFIALSPAISLMILNPWKDIAYSLALLVFILLMLVIFQSHGEWLGKRFAWLVLGLIGALAALYRHNGAPVALAGLFLLFAGYPRRWKPILAAILLAAGAWLLVKGPLYQALNVNSSNVGIAEPTGFSDTDASLTGDAITINQGSVFARGFGQNLGLAGTAAILVNWHIHAGASLNPEELILYRQAVPLEEGFDLVALAQHSREIQKLAIRLAVRDPLTTLDFLKNASRFIFQVLQPPYVRLGYVELAVQDNPFGFQPASKLPWLQPMLKNLAMVSEAPALDWFFWRNAFWMYFLILSSVIAAVRWRRWQVLLVVAPVLLNALPLAVFSGGQISRYILPTLLAGPLLCGYFLVSSPSKASLATKV